MRPLLARPIAAHFCLRTQTDFGRSERPVASRSPRTGDRPRQRIPAHREGPATLRGPVDRGVTVATAILANYLAPVGFEHDFAPEKSVRHFVNNFKNHFRMRFHSIGAAPRLTWRPPACLTQNITNPPHVRIFFRPSREIPFLTVSGAVFQIEPRS